MSLTLKSFFIALLSMMLLSGCIHRELVISGQKADTVSNTDNEDTTDTDAEPVEKAVIRRIPFPEDEYKTLARSGKGTIKGSIYIMDDNNKRVYGKNTRLYLNPVTSYSKQWYEQSYIGGYSMEKSDKRLFNYLKFTSSNSRGRFAFYGVPSGSYYLIGMVKCGSACGYESVRNIRVAKEVTINDNDTKTVALSRMSY